MAGLSIEQRKYPIGAEILPGGGVHFRIWAPKPHRIALVVEGGGAHLAPQPLSFEMLPEGNGYFSCLVSHAHAGTRYRFHLDETDYLYPDPASRFQPQGPHGPSQVVDPFSYEWTDTDWPGVSARNQILYEMHIGTFTLEGTFRAAARELAELAKLGITVIELMPIAEFDGKFGWGYDGVALFAPYHVYGTPDDFKFFIDQAHAVGIGVILDVVYNHCGPSGCYLRQFSEDYFSTVYVCEWGDPINFDSENAGPVREFFLTNAAYWIEEFHLDGLRIDATQQIFDSSEEHILVAVLRQVRIAAGKRSTYVVGESEPQQSQLARSLDKHGFGIDALWNDDFHRSAVVALKGSNEAYFTDYLGRPQEFVSLAKWGYLYQGQWYRWQKKRRGSPGFDLAPSVFVNFLENHDQVANAGLGKRLHQLVHPGLYRALTALLLLGPAAPMLFQGQEFASSAPFLYFADHHPELAVMVQKGRTEFLHQFPSLAAPETQAYLSAPHDPATFSRCKLDPAERLRNQAAYALHADLLRLRREDPVFSLPRHRGLDGAVLSDHAFVLRFFSLSGKDDRLLLINLGLDMTLSPVPEPLLAPHQGCDWQLLWSSEHPRYGGHGTGPVDTTENWRLPGCAAIVLKPLAPGDRQHAE